MSLSKIRFKRLSNSTAIGKAFRFAFCQTHAVKVRHLQVIWVYSPLQLTDILLEAQLISSDNPPPPTHRA